MFSSASDTESKYRTRYENFTILRVEIPSNASEPLINEDLEKNVVVWSQSRDGLKTEIMYPPVIVLWLRIN